MPRVTPVLRRKREELDLATAQVAAAVGISEGTLRNIESGSKPGSGRLLHRLARFLEVSFDELIAEDDDESEPAKKNEHETGGASTGPKDNRPPTKDAADRIAS